ncbi:MAG: 30S ribosomal protein S17 [bacterium]|nr:30S ribosomal protein S17 [bacterium]
MEKAEETKRLYKTRIGHVVGNKMQKTVKVEVRSRVKHKKFEKYVVHSSVFMAHDEKSCHLGDKVLIVETRPLSKKKRWQVREVLHRAEQVAAL